MSTLFPDRTSLAAEPHLATRPILLWGMRLAALVATGVCIYLASVTMAAAGGVGCGGGFDCDEVLQSGWSTWFGLPVAVPAVSLYASLLCALAFSGPLAPAKVRWIAWTIALSLSVLAGAAALWFFALQFLVLGKLCSWCLTVHLCGLGLAALALAGGHLNRRRLQTVAAVALGGLCVLIGGQFVGVKTPPNKLEHIAATPPTPVRDHEPKNAATQRLTVDDLYVDDLKLPPNNPPTTVVDPETAATDPATSEATEPSLDDLEVPMNAPPNQPPIELPARAHRTSTAATRSRVVSLFRGDAQIDVYQHPVLGSPEAPYVIVKLFDYTCPHCREMHEHLRQVQREFGGKLAVVMCPVPLNRQCNPHVNYDSAKHADACDLARLALAVWQADQTKFAQFDAWLFAASPPPSAAAAKEMASSLVGEKQLAAELYSGALRERLAVGPKLYKLFGGGTVPKLVLPTGLLVGPGESTQAVLIELRKEFEAPPAP